jgi:ferredoxin
MPAKLLEKKCIRCGACIDECPLAAISYGDNNMPVVDEAICDDCGACEKVCCTQALVL